jgi:glutamine---fructose-6-phosphate transaminase (isomerizing)
MLPRSSSWTGSAPARGHLACKRTISPGCAGMRRMHGDAEARIEPMCGIVGYVGERASMAVLMGGLSRLEYRGYDSAGVAVIDGDGRLGTSKKAGKLQALADELGVHPISDGRTGIGHTRWATHGGPTDSNAHPHLGDEGRLALIHNGIIENFSDLKQELLDAGAIFESETDSEVAAVLLGRAYRDTGDLREAFRRVVARLDGAFTLLAVHADEPGLVVGARRNSPLVIGLGEGENFLGSDVAAFVEYTRNAVAIGQDQIVAITPDSVTVTDFDGEAVTVEPFEVAWDASAAEKGGWPSFMDKEVSEQPDAVANTMRGRVQEGRVVVPELTEFGDDALLGIHRIIIIACGTAAYAGMVAKYAIEKWTRVSVEVELSHEFRYREPVLSDDTLVISISQSGETMDTLMAVKYARLHGAKTISVCNTQGATIPRESDGVVYTHAGPEVAVASTKAFVAQVVALYLFGLHLARVRGSLSADELASNVAELAAIPEKLQTVLAQRGRVEQLARWMADTRSVLFLGRHVGYPISLEGALKLKELAYIHAEGFAAGELKHGPIALIEPGQPVFVIVPSPRGSSALHPKVVSNIQEIRARGARVIAIAEAGDAAVLPFADEVLRIPLAAPLFEPLLAVVPLQIFAMELATAKGLDVDQPRNLAKSVTVE